MCLPSLTGIHLVPSLRKSISLIGFTTCSRREFHAKSVLCIQGSAAVQLPAMASSPSLPLDSLRKRNCVISFADMATTISELHQAHAQMVKTGLAHTTFAASRIIAFAANSNDPQAIEHANSIFVRTARPNSFMWNTMLRAHAHSPTPHHTLLLFHRMLHSSTAPDKFTFPFLLTACSRLLAVEPGQQIHALITKTNIASDVFIQNTLIHMYASFGYLDNAFYLFDRMPERDIISWNTIISVCVQNGHVKLARHMFDEMPERNVESWNFMISGYTHLGLVEDARNLFDEMPRRDVVSWNAMLTGYVHAGLFDNALELFDDMLNAKMRPDSFTLVNVLSACASLGSLTQGEWIHAYIDKNMVEIDGFLGTALVDMYSKCGCIEKSLQVFNMISRKDISTWNSIIAGLSMHGYGEDALRMFAKMSVAGFEPNKITFTCVLSACNHMGLLNEGCRIFDLMTRVHGIAPNTEHFGCMVDMLGRAGLLKEAEELIRRMLVKDAPVAWESLLGACTRHGDLELAERVAMRLMELDPKESACYVQLSNVYASVGRWDDVREVRKKMRVRRVRKEPGCSMIYVDGVVHDFLAGDQLHPVAGEMHLKVNEMIHEFESLEVFLDTN